jgi:hypothetical protein
MSLQQLHGEPALNSPTPTPLISMPLQQEMNGPSSSMSMTNDLNEIEFEKRLFAFERSMTHQTILPSFDFIHDDSKNETPHLNQQQTLFSNYVKHAKQFI